MSARIRPAGHGFTALLVLALPLAAAASPLDRLPLEGRAVEESLPLIGELAPPAAGASPAAPSAPIPSENLFLVMPDDASQIVPFPESEPVSAIELALDTPVASEPTEIAPLGADAIRDAPNLPVAPVGVGLDRSSPDASPAGEVRSPLPLPESDRGALLLAGLVALRALRRSMR